MDHRGKADRDPSRAGDARGAGLGEPRRGQSPRGRAHDPAVVPAPDPGRSPRAGSRHCRRHGDTPFDRGQRSPRCTNPRFGRRPAQRASSPRLPRHPSSDHTGTSRTTGTTPTLRSCHRAERLHAHHPAAAGGQQLFGDQLPHLANAIVNSCTSGGDVAPDLTAARCSERALDSYLVAHPGGRLDAPAGLDGTLELAGSTLHPHPK